MNEMYKFWMVWVEGKSGPTKKHFTIDEARLEAERSDHTTIKLKQ